MMLLWDKQQESRRVFWNLFPYGGPEGPPVWKHKAFQLFVSLWGSKTEENAADSFRERPQTFLTDSLSFLKPSVRNRLEKLPGCKPKVCTL